MFKLEYAMSLVVQAWGWPRVPSTSLCKLLNRRVGNMGCVQIGPNPLRNALYRCHHDTRWLILCVVSMSVGADINVDMSAVVR